MQGLEKILEEINAEFDRRIGTQLQIMGGLGDDVYRYGYGKSLEAYQQGKLFVEDIIRKHMNDMNDDWIPVEERLPEEAGYYLVQLSRKLPNEDYSDRVVVLYSRYDKEFMTYNSLIIAWRPLPEVYHPKKTKLPFREE